MTNEPTDTALFSALMADQTERESLWCILDGARDESIFGRVGSAGRHCCLYAGSLPFEVQAAAPYLVELSGGPATRNLVRSAWGNSWGIFFRSEAPMEKLRQHLRTFLRVADQKGRRLIFRYYDPRVLRVYLPTCLPEELHAVFGPIGCYLVENPRADAVMRFSFRNNRLEVESLPVLEPGAKSLAHHS